MNKGHKIQLPDMPGQYELVRDVPDHEILLVFRDDDDATSFREWLEGEGWNAFAASMNGGAK